MNKTKRQHPCGHLSLVEKWLPPEMACETVNLSTLWGFFLGLGSLGECFCWRVVHLTGPLSLHQLPPQNWTEKKGGHETAQPRARCRNEPTGPWAIQTMCFGWCLKIREHLQEFPHTNDYAFGMKEIISKMIFYRLSKFETYVQFYQRLLNHHKTQLVSDLKAAGSAGSWGLVGRPSSVGSREKRDVKSKLT